MEDNSEFDTAIEFSPFFQPDDKCTFYLNYNIKYSLIDNHQAVKDILKHCELLHGIAIALADSKAKINTIKTFDQAYHFLEEKLNKSEYSTMKFDEVNASVQLFIYSLAKGLSETGDRTVEEYETLIQERDGFFDAESKHHMVVTSKKPSI